MEYKQSEETPEKKVGASSPSPKKSFAFLTFRERRSFDLHLGRKVFRFEGRETKKIPLDLLTENKGWTTSIKKKFLVK